MEYTKDEIESLKSILGAILTNSEYNCPGYTLRQATVYNLDDFDMETVEKWFNYFTELSAWLNGNK